MSYRISGLDPAPFRHLYGRSTEVLAREDIVRVTVADYPGSPCRITLEDLAIGTTALLLNYEHLPVASPYRSRHAIFVAEGAQQAAAYRGAVPEVMRRRLLSVRSFGADGMMLDADVLPGDALHDRIAGFLADPRVAFLHAHNAKPGCFAARIDRV